MFRSYISRVLGHSYQPFFAPDGDGDIGAVSDLDALEDDDAEKEEETEDDSTTDDDSSDEDSSGDKRRSDKADKTDDEGEEEGEEEDGEDGEEEEEDDEESDEDKEQDRLLSSWTDIKKQYPDFAKKFPDVKAALFRDQQYSSLFATPKEAEDVIGKADTLDKLGEDLIGQGDPTALLDTIGKQSPENLKKMALNILPYFQEKDKTFYYELAAVPIKQLLRSAFKSGGKDTDLGRAALHLHKYFFNDLDIDKTVKGEVKDSKEVDPKVKALEDRLNQINQREEKAFLDSIDTSYDSKMTKSIREGLDKDERLTEWAKTQITSEVMKEIHKLLSSDKNHTNQMTSLFKQAKTAGFTNDFKTRLINTVLVRAKALVPNVRAKMVSQALNLKKKKDDTTKEDNKKHTPVTQFKKRDKTNTSSRNTPPKFRTDIDVLRS